MYQTRDMTGHVAVAGIGPPGLERGGKARLRAGIFRSRAALAVQATRHTKGPVDVDSPDTNVHPDLGADEVRDGDLARMIEDLDADLRRMSGHRILITGAAGFLGYYLSQVPLAWNDAHPDEPAIGVAVMDNFFREAPIWLKELGQRPEVEVLVHDVREPLPDPMGDFAYIIHAAGIASPTYYRAHPIETMDANITGLRSLLEYARGRREAGLPMEGFLFYSSSEIYGDPAPEAIPTPETYRGFVSCTGPRACYDESKRYGETLCVNFARQYGLPVTAARPFNNYGPGMKITDGRVIADFFRDALAGRDLTMLSDGSPTRTFCYVSDAITGYYRVLLRGRPGEAYNVGVDGPEISMLELAEAVTGLANDLLGRQVKVVRGHSAERDYLVDNPNRRCPDITKAREELQYRPQVALADGLSRTLRWYTGNLGGEER
jgi:UDP-glucuronate decarboxylase